jgi:hypothetical protein
MTNQALKQWYDIWPSTSNHQQYLWLQTPHFEDFTSLLKWTRFDYNQQPSRMSISQFHTRSSFPLSLLATVPRLFATTTGEMRLALDHIICAPKLCGSENERKKKRRAGAPGSEMPRHTSSRKRRVINRRARKGETECSPPWLPRRDAEISNPKPLTWIGKRGVESLNWNGRVQWAGFIEVRARRRSTRRGGAIETTWGRWRGDVGGTPELGPTLFRLYFGVRSKSMGPDLSPRIRCGLTGPGWIAVPPRRSDPLAMWVAMGLETSWAEICLAAVRPIRPVPD